METCSDTATNVYIRSYLHDRHPRMVPHLRASASRCTFRKKSGGTKVRTRRRQTQTADGKGGESLTKLHSITPSIATCVLDTSTIAPTLRTDDQTTLGLFCRLDLCPSGPRRCTCRVWRSASRSTPQPGQFPTAVYLRPE